MTRSLGLGGTERQVAEFAASLDRTRFTPHVGCFEDDGFRAAELRAQGIPILRMDMHSFASSDTPRAFWRLRNYVREHQIALIHTFDHPMNVFGVPAARALRVPVVLASQRSHRELIPPKYLPLIRMSDRLAHGIVVNCEAVRRHLIKDYGVSAPRVHVCYNSLDTDRFAPGARIRPPELAGADLVIGTVSVLRAVKSISTLVEAFAARHAGFPGARLVIVGNGPERPRLEAQVKALGIGSAVLFHDATSHVEEWLRAIDVFVSASLSEALSNSVLEALASGCCVIASRVGGNPELVQHGETGLLFSPGEPVDLAHQLETAMSSAELRERLGIAGSHYVREKFRRDVSAARMAEIYAGYLEKQR